MSRADIKLPILCADIQKYIPHRYPFLLIDKILEMEPGKTILAVKNVSISDPILQGHFPGLPVYPGVLMIEGMAQTSGVLGYFSTDSHQDILLTEVISARFRKPVIPGDVLHYEIEVEKQRPPFFWFKGVAKVAGTQVASAQFSALLK